MYPADDMKAPRLLIITVISHVAVMIQIMDFLQQQDVVVVVVATTPRTLLLLFQHYHPPLPHHPLARQPQKAQQQRWRRQPLPIIFRGRDTDSSSNYDQTMSALHGFWDTTFSNLGARSEIGSLWHCHSRSTELSEGIFCSQTGLCQTYKEITTIANL